MPTRGFDAASRFGFEEAEGQGSKEQRHMAGDWIKMRTDLASDPAVVRIAARLKKNEDTIVGKLHRLWSWADKHAVDGKIYGVGTEYLDKQVSCRGFSQVMIEVGWLIEFASGIEFPNFDRHNGRTAKMRADMQLRKQKERDKNVKSVTGMSQKYVTETRHNLIREEKRRVSIESNRSEVDSDRSAKALGMGNFGTFLAGKLPTRNAKDVQFLTLIGRAVDERRIAESLVQPALQGCDSKSTKSPIGMFRAALALNIKAAGGELDSILESLNGGGDDSDE